MLIGGDSSEGLWPFVRNGLPIAGAVAMLFVFAGGGLRAGFTHDDLMNAATALRRPLLVHVRDVFLFLAPSATYRPTGSLFYVLLFQSFGFSPLPYRVCCYGLMSVNLALSFRLAHRLSGSRRGAAATALLLAYHGNYWPLYVNTGLCYDLLCCFFYASAFLYYLHVRGKWLAWTWWRVAAWVAMYAFCLGSKEMAVSLPVVMLAWEVLTQPPAFGFSNRTAWLAEHARIPLAGIGMNGLFILGRVLGPNGISGAGGYHIEVSATQYLGHARHFLALALYEPKYLTPVAAIIVAAGLVAAVIVLRDPAVTLGLFWAAAGILPVAFIPQRGLDAVYIPALGLCLTPAIAAGALAGLAGGLALWHGHNGLFELEPRQADSHEIAAVFEWFRSQGIRFPADSRTLFLRDPFPDHAYSSAFLLQLYSGDFSLSVVRSDRAAFDLAPDEVVNFDSVYSFEKGRLARCESAPFRGVRGSDLAGLAARTSCRQVGTTGVEHGRR